MPEAAIFRARSFIISHRAPLPVLLPTVRERSEPAPLLSYSTNWCCNSNRAPRILSTSTFRDALLSAPEGARPRDPDVSRPAVHDDLLIAGDAMRTVQRCRSVVHSLQPTSSILCVPRTRTFDRRCLCPCSVPRTLHWSGYEFRLVLRAGPQSKGCFQEMRAQCLFLGSEHARLMRGHRECDG